MIILQDIYFVCYHFEEDEEWRVDDSVHLGDFPKLL